MNTENQVIKKIVLQGDQENKRVNRKWET